MTMELQPVVQIDARNTVPRVLVQQAERYGRKPLIRFPRENEELTYEALVASSEAASARLRTEYKFEPGTVAAIYQGNSADYVKAWFACLFAGLIDVPINHEFKKTTLLFGLNTVEAQIVFTDAEGAQNLVDDEVRGYLKKLKLIVLAGSTPDRIRELASAVENGPTVASLDELVQQGPPSRLWEEIDATSAALIRFTSGTTGAPKGILQSHLHVLGKSAVHNRIFEFGHDDVLYSPFPMHHNLASINGLIGTIQAGATMVSVPRFSASRYWQEIRECGATRAHLLQSIAPLVSAQPPSDADRQHKVRLLWTGGPDPEFEERFNVRWISTYALAEIGAIAFKQGSTRGDTGTGVPLPEMEVRIVDSLGRPVAAGTRGEITIRPRQPHRVMLAYYNNLSATMRAFRDLWFHTGDAGFIAEDGELHFLGRIGDTIRRRGVNISSEQVEGELRRHPNVLDCGVIAIPVGRGDDDIHACVLWKEPPSDLPLAFRELSAFLNDRLSREYVPRYFESVSALPRTNTGKVQKAVLRDRSEFGRTWDRQSESWIQPRVTANRASLSLMEVTTKETQ